MFDFYNFFYNDKRSNSRRFSEKVLKDNNIYDIILEKTKFLDEDFYTLGDRIRCVSYNIESKPICENCGKSHNNWNNDAKGLGYRKYCSKKCSNINLGEKISEGRKNVDETLANNKRRKTMLTKYGFEYNSQRPEIKELMSKGLNNQLPESSKIKLRDPIWMNEQYTILRRNAISIANELNCHYTTVCSWLYKHDVELRSGSPRSSYEFEIERFLESNNIKGIYNKKIIYPHEIDIFLPEFNFGIEFNGLWAHSEEQKEKDYHLMKTNKMSELGNKLIHVFEDEWNFKKR